MTLTSPDDAEFEQQQLEEAERGRRLAIFGLVGGFLAILVIIVTVQWITDSDDGDTAEALPDLTFTTLDGAQFGTADLIGQPTVINFFASWCAPCRAEMPAFENVHQANLGDVAFVGVNTRETSADQAREIVEETGITYTVLLGDDGGPGSLYQSVTDLGFMPTTALIAEDGTIAAVHTGVLNESGLQDLIDEVFG